MLPEPVELRPELVEGPDSVEVGPELVEGPDPPAPRSADIFSRLESPVIVEQKHPLDKSKRRSVLLREGQRWQLPAVDDLSISCDHPRLRWTPGHEMILRRCQREDWPEPLQNDTFATQNDRLALCRNDDLPSESRHVWQGPEHGLHPAVSSGGPPQRVCRLILKHNNAVADDRASSPLHLPIPTMLTIARLEGSGGTAAVHDHHKPGTHGR